jgi:hypothetical protein
VRPPRAVIQLLSLNESLSHAQKGEAKLAEELGLPVLTLHVAAPLKEILLTDGPLPCAFTVTLDTTTPWESVRRSQSPPADPPCPPLLFRPTL